MKGAREYNKLFKKTHQKGRLFFVVGSHARGGTFRVYILPEGEEAKQNGSSNPPLNSGCVEVYGVVNGQPGWTESYGWLHKGAWQVDFEDYVKTLKSSQADNEDHLESIRKDAANKAKDKIQLALSKY